MNDSSFKSAHSYSATQFQAYQQTITRHQIILKLVRSAVPKQFANSIHYCLPKSEHLIIFTDSAAWSSQLRFFESALLRILHESGYINIEKIKLKILQQRSHTQKTSQPSLPDLKSVSIIESIALSRKQDRLASALLRLSDTLERKHKNSSRDTD